MFVQWENPNPSQNEFHFWKSFTIINHHQFTNLNFQNPKCWVKKISTALYGRMGSPCKLWDAGCHGPLCMWELHQSLDWFPTLSLSRLVGTLRTLVLGCLGGFAGKWIHSVDGSEIRREHQLRLVVEIPLFAIFTTGFIYPNGCCLGVLNHQQ